MPSLKVYNPLKVALWLPPKLQVSRLEADTILESCDGKLRDITLPLQCDI